MARSWLSLIPLGFVAVQWVAAASDPGSEAGRPLVQTCRAGELQAKGPIFSFAETTGEAVFVGSNCLSISDGRRWQSVDIPGAYAFRALAADTDPTGHERVWVGAAGALGYMRRTTLGNWTFVSLRSRLPAAVDAAALTLWSVFPSGRGAIFVGEHEILRWNGERFSVWKLSGGPRLQAFREAAGIIWIHRDGVGLLQLSSDGDPVLARPASGLPPGRLAWILPGLVSPPASPGEAGAGAFVGTSAGVFLLARSGFVRLPKLSAAMEGVRAVQAISLGGDMMAIGTEHNGVVLAMRDDRIVARIAAADGADDNTIYCLWRNLHGNLWIGWSLGCSRVEGIGRTSVFGVSDGLQTGLPRRVVTAFARTHVLTDQALYRIEPRFDANAQLARVAVPGSRINDAAVGPEGLWIGASAGLSLVTDDEAAPCQVASGPVTCLAAVPWLPRGVVYGTEAALWAVAPGPRGEWSNQRLPYPFQSSPRSILSDDMGDLWVATRSEGIIRFSVERRTAGTPVLHLAAHYQPGSGLPEATGECRLAFTAGRMCAFSETAILEFEPGRGFLPAPAFAGWIAVAATLPPAVVPGRTAGAPPGYWVARRLAPLDDAPPYAVLRVFRSGVPGSPLRWETADRAGAGPDC